MTAEQKMAIDEIKTKLTPEEVDYAVSRAGLLSLCEAAVEVGELHSEICTHRGQCNTCHNFSVIMMVLYAATFQGQIDEAASPLLSPKPPQSC